MSREDVNIRVSANIAEAVRLWKAMEQGPAGMAREMAGLSRAGGAAGNQMASGFDRAIGKWTSLAAKIKGAKFLLDGYMAANREAMQMQDEASVHVDTLMRQFAVQANLSGLAMQKAQADVAAIAKRRGVGLDTAMDMAKQMASSDFSLDEIIKGGALDAGLATANAMAATGKGFNATEFTAAISQYLNATGQAKTAENVMRVGQQMFTLYQRTDVNPADMKELAPEAKKIGEKTGMNDAEMMAMFSLFRDVTSAANASTAMRSGYVSLATAGGDKKRERALAEIGLTPRDVDFDGENFLQVQERLTRAVEGLSKGERSSIAKRLFGQEGLLFESVLLNQEGLAMARERVGWTGDREAFTNAAKTTEESMQADRNRAEIDKAMAFADPSVIDSATARSRLITGLKNRGAWTVTRALAAEGFDRAIGWGMDTEEAVKYVTPGWAPWRALGSPSERVEFQREVLERTKAEPVNVPAAPQQVDVKVDVRLIDQNNMRIPHRAEVHDVGKNAASRRNR